MNEPILLVFAAHQKTIKLSTSPEPDSEGTHNQGL